MLFSGREFRPGPDERGPRVSRSKWGAMLALGLLVGGIRAETLRLTPWEGPGGAATFPVTGEVLANPMGSANLSGATAFQAGGRPFLALVSDEGTEFAVVPLSGEGAGREALVYDVLELMGDANDLGETDEIDLEGVSFEDGHLFLAGSATVKRKKPNRETLEENLLRLHSVVPVSGGKADTKGKRVDFVKGEKGDGKWNLHSNLLYRFAVSLEAGRPRFTFVEHHDIRRRIGESKLLRRFLPIPSKENGLDLEGFVRHQGRNYLGLRGPVLRGHAVVAELDEDFQELTPHFLFLDGFGIRSMEYFSHPRWGEGFFLVAGLTMEGTAPFTLFRWDGQGHAFMQAGEGLTRIGTFPAPDPAWKAEGLFGCGEDLCVSFDGPPGGRPHRLH